jgi:hypothetical protein
VTPQGGQIVAQQPAFLGHASAQLILMNQDARVAIGEHRNIPGVVGVKMGDETGTLYFVVGASAT